MTSDAAKGILGDAYIPNHPNRKAADYYASDRPHCWLGGGEDGHGMAHISFYSRAPAYKGYLGRLRRRAPPAHMGYQWGGHRRGRGRRPRIGHCGGAAAAAAAHPHSVESQVMVVVSGVLLGLPASTSCGSPKGGVRAEGKRNTLLVLLLSIKRCPTPKEWDPKTRMGERKRFGNC